MTALPAVILLYHRKKSQNSWEYQNPKISLAIAIVLFIGTTTLLYGSFIEPNILITKKQTIDLPNIENPIKIVLFADMQVGPTKQTKHVERVVKKILDLNPDLVFIAGDHVNNGITKVDETIYLKPLEKLTAKIPTYAVHGNHEYGVSYSFGKNKIKSYLPDKSSQTKETMELLGVKYLINDLELVHVNDEKFYLFGGDSHWAGKLDFSSLDSKTEADLDIIALIHNPAAAWEAAKHSVDLFLAGHTHGGQVRLPLIGPMARVDNVIPASWYKGGHVLDKMKIFVTSGTGETGTRARLFNPPEIALLTIQ